MIRRFGRLLLVPVRGAAGLWRSARRIPEVVDAVLVLPQLAQQIERVGIQTATLLEMQREIALLRGDTAALRSIDQTLGLVAAHLQRVDANTVHVEQLASVLLPLQGAAVRVGRAADRLPARRLR